jgi:hypothetical protein
LAVFWSLATDVKLTGFYSNVSLESVFLWLLNLEILFYWFFQDFPDEIE